MGLLDDIWKGLTDLWEFAWTPIDEHAKPQRADSPMADNTIRQGAMDLGEDLNNAVGDTANNIYNFFSNTGNGIADFFQGIFDWFAGIGKWLEGNWWLIAIVVVLFAILYFGRGGGMGFGGGGGTDDRDTKVIVSNKVYSGDHVDKGKTRYGKSYLQWKGQKK